MEPLDLGKILIPCPINILREDSGDYSSTTNHKLDVFGRTVYVVSVVPFKEMKDGKKHSRTTGTKLESGNPELYA